MCQVSVLEHWPTTQSQSKSLCLKSSVRQWWSCESMALKLYSFLSAQWSRISGHRFRESSLADLHSNYPWTIRDTLGICCYSPHSTLRIPTPVGRNHPNALVSWLPPMELRPPMCPKSHPNRLRYCKRSSTKQTSKNLLVSDPFAPL